MSKKYLYSILILSVLGCRSAEDVVGSYSSDKTSMANHILQIKENGTFEYHLKAELMDVLSNGTWYLSDERELVLNSDESLQAGVIDFVEEFDSSTETLNVKLIDEDDQALSHAAITWNGDEANGFSVDDTGIGSYELIDLDTLTIHYLGKKYEYVLSKPNSNKLILTIRLQSESTIFFNNEVWKVHGKNIRSKNNLILRRRLK